MKQETLNKVNEFDEKYLYNRGDLSNVNHIFIDLEGTLSTCEGGFFKRTRKALEKLKEKSIKIYILSNSEESYFDIFYKNKLDFEIDGFISSRKGKEDILSLEEKTGCNLSNSLIVDDSFEVIDNALKTDIHKARILSADNPHKSLSGIYEHLLEEKKRHYKGVEKISLVYSLDAFLEFLVKKIGATEKDNNQSLSEDNIVALEELTEWGEVFRKETEWASDLTIGDVKDAKRKLLCAKPKGAGGYAPYVG